MAKKKKSTAASASTAASSKDAEPMEVETSESSLTTTTTAAPREEQPETAGGWEVDEALAPGQSSQDSGDKGEDAAALKQRLAGCEAEIASLKALLAQRDEELESLRTAKAAAAAPTASTPLAPPSEDIQKLQERLATVKRDQAEADAAREAAWRQLKSVVAEISRLAGPEAKPPPTPTAQTA